MRKLKIVSDSSSDILKLDNVDYAYAPMKIITAEREFVDNENLDVEIMANFFNEYKERSQTSCPNPADWMDAFGDADDIICVTITSALSGSYNSACTAKRMYEDENEGKRVFVLDTLSAGPEITLIVRKLEELAESGMAYEEICDEIQNYIKNTGLVFMLKSLKISQQTEEYLRLWQNLLASPASALLARQVMKVHWNLRISVVVRVVLLKRLLLILKSLDCGTEK